jgi:hypothetical protein
MFRRILALVATAVALVGSAGACSSESTDYPNCEKGSVCTVVLRDGETLDGVFEYGTSDYDLRLVSIDDEWVTVAVNDEQFKVSNAHPGRVSAAFGLEMRLKKLEMRLKK